MLERIKELCEDRGITINALEKATGVGRGNIARWDDHAPGIEKVEAVADYFGVTVDYLLGKESDINEILKEAAKAKVLQEAFDLRPEMRMLFSVAQSATKEDIEQAIKIIEALKK